MGTRATEFSKLIQSMTGKHQLWEIWADFVTMAACCISNSVDSGNRERREDLYNRTAGKYEQDEINNMGSLLGLVILALEEEPEQDFLGEMYMQLELGSHWHGQFFTPYNVGTFLLTTVLLTTCFIRRFVQTAALRWTERNGRTMSNVDIMFTHKDEEAPFEQSESKRLYNGAKVKATVVSVKPNEAVVELGTKHTGYIPLDELTNDPNAKVEDIVKVGDEIDAIVTKVDDSQGVVFLSKKRVDSALGMEKIAAAKEANETLEGVVTQAVKGGVIVVTNGTRVFIPASQTGVPRSGKLEDLVKKTVQFKVIEINEQRNRVVGSIRQATREVRDAERAKFWESIQVGQKFEGEVRSIEDYGVFVDIGPVDGLVRTSELTWNRVGHPKDIVKEGDKITVIVKSFDPEKKRVSLSAKDPDENPWTKFVEEYQIGDVIKATIVSITEFGAFAQIIPGVDGLIHISQISTERVTNINNVLTVGQEVEAKIIDIDTEKNRVSLSIKALMEDNETLDAE